MTRLRQPAPDFASAALRHLRDADVLVTTSPVQSLHLAGFGPECARKAALTRGWATRALGHDAAQPELVAWALDLDGVAARTVGTPAPDLGWRPDCRYWASGARTGAEARAMVDRCAADAMPILVRLWAQGRRAGDNES
jgi:hypothetical protein